MPLDAGFLPHRAQRGGQIPFDVDLPGDVGIGKTEFVRPPQEAAQGDTGVEHDPGSSGRTRLAAVPRPQAYRYGAGEVPSEERGRRPATCVIVSPSAPSCSLPRSAVS